MIRMGPHGGRSGPAKSDAVEGSMEDQEALDLAADWADISQGLRKDLGHQLFAARWPKPSSPRKSRSASLRRTTARTPGCMVERSVR